MHVVAVDNTITSEGEAALAVLEALPVVGALARSAQHRQVVRTWATNVYRFVADRRHLFGRLVPDVAPPSRRPGVP
jgi:hypothetical protein